ncbi:MAG: hypothetical protein WDN66_02620 [Candidatus Saccharibacteria bacterium]
MSFEFLDSDLATVNAKNDFVTVYTHLRSADTTFGLFDRTGTYSSWAKTSPVEADRFLEFCSTHELPEMRTLAHDIAIDWVESNPDLVTRVLVTGLTDSDRLLVENAADIVHDHLENASNPDDFIKPLGLHNLAEIIRAYKAATEEPGIPSQE